MKGKAQIQSSLVYDGKLTSMFLKLLHSFDEVVSFFHCSMYDVDGNGFIDLMEMTKIVRSIYNMMGPNQVAMDQFESPEARAEGIFRRMDVDSDGKVTRQEFVRCCLEDQKLIDLLTPNVGA